MNENIRYSGEFRTKDNGSLSPPSGIIIDKNKNIIVVDEFNHRIQTYDNNGNLINSFGKKGNGKGEFYYPKGIAVDSEGFYYIADCWNHRVQKFSQDAASKGVWKFINSFGGYGDDEGKFNEPYDIAICKDRIYVLDRCNHRIQVFDRDGNLHGVIGHRGTVIEEDLAELFDTPLNLFSSPAFEFPTGIAADNNGNIYVADSGNHRIVKLKKDGEVLLSFGQKGSNQGEFQYPHDIAIDSEDTIFVSDLNNNRIQAFTPQGNLLFSTDTGKDKSDKFASPTVLSIDNEGRLYSGMGFDTRVIIFEYKIAAASRQPPVTNQEPIDNISSIIDKIKKVGDEIIQIKDERIGISEDYITRIINKENNILNPPKEDINFDETLHSHEKDDRTFIRDIRYKLLTHKRLIRNKCGMISAISSGKKSLPEASVNIVKNSISQLVREAHFLLDLLEEKKKYESEAERHFRDELRSKEENWRDFRIAIRKSDMIQEILPHIFSSFNLLLTTIKKLLTSFHDSQIFQERYVFAKIILHSDGMWEHILPLEENIKEIFGAIPEILSVKGDEKSPISFSNLPLSLTVNDLSNSILIEGLGISNREVSEIKNWQTSLSAQQTLDNIELIKNKLEQLLQEREKIGEEIIKIDNALAHLPVREEKMRLPYLNNKILWGFHDRLNQRRIGELLTAYQILSSILIYRISGGEEEFKEKLTEMLNSYEEQMALSSKIRRQAHDEEVACKAELDKIIFSVDNDKAKEIELKNRLFNISRRLQFTNIYSGRIRGSLTLYRKLTTHDSQLTTLKFDMSFGSYGKGAGEFNLPGAIISDTAGNLYISDEMNYRIQKLNKDGEFILSFGGFGTIEGKFKMPSGMAVDKNGDVLVSDWINHRIQKFSPDGSFISSFGKYGSSDAEFNRPSRIAVDKEGYIYVADLGNKRIQKFNQDWKFIMSFRNEMLKEPFSIYIFPKQELIVGELNGDRIAVFNKDGNFVKTIGGEGTGDGKFMWIGAISSDKKENIYLADFWNSRIQIFSKDLEFISSFGKFGRGAGEFDCIPSLATADEFLYACDYFNHRIQRFRITVKE